MSRIFLSHSSCDNFEAIAVRDWLASQGWDDVFLDIDPNRGIAAGARWERALYTAANRCEAVIFLISPDWLASRWCRKEYWLARGLNKSLLAVLISRDLQLAQLPDEYKDTWQVISIVSGQDLQIYPIQLLEKEKHVALSKEGLQRLKHGLDKTGLDAKYFAWPPQGDLKRPPYRGLEPLEADDAGIFFGRDAPLVEALDRLRGMRLGAAPRLFVILGASGAGKSSFLRAGLMPRLARDDINFIALRPIRPERAALSGKSGLLGALEAAFTNRPRSELRQAIQAGANGIRPLLRELVARLLSQRAFSSAAPKPPSIVMSVDQSEELFRPEGKSEAQPFLELLRDLTAVDDPPVIVIFAIRSDAYDALQQEKSLEGLPQTAQSLAPMPLGLFAEVITGPAKRVTQAGAKLELEPALVEQLLTDLDKGGSDALPLLALTLEQLYLEYGAAGTLKLTDYQSFGGLKGSIDKAVEAALRQADANPRIPQDREARELLLRRGFIPWLAGIDPESKAIRRNKARTSDIPPESRPLIELLVDQRLLSTDVVTSKELASGAGQTLKTIEPAHEALLRQWDLLQGWLAGQLDAFTALDSVQRAARDWNANGQTNAWLVHQGQRLSDAAILQQSPDISAQIDALDRHYLAKCHARNQRIKWQSRAAIAGLILLSLVTALFGVYGQVQRDSATQLALEAKRQRDTAIQREARAQLNQSIALTVLSDATLQDDATIAAKFALAAWPRRLSDGIPQLDSTLDALSAAVMNIRERLILKVGAQPVRTARFSPDGSMVLTSLGPAEDIQEGNKEDEVVHLWDAQTGRSLALFRGHTGGVTSADFSPNGRWLAISTPAAVHLWDVRSRLKIQTYEIGTGHRLPVRFSPDSTRLFLTSPRVGQSSELVDVETGQDIARLSLYADQSDEESGAPLVAFTPDGSRLIAFGRERQPAGLWNARTGTLLSVLDEPRPNISPDGSRILTTSGRLLDPRDGRQIAVVSGNVNANLFAAHAPIFLTIDGSAAYVWDTQTGAKRTTLDGHHGEITYALISPDGSHVFLLTSKHETQLWNVARQAEEHLPQEKFDTPQSGFFSADGRVIYIQGPQEVIVWDLNSDGYPSSRIKGWLAFPSQPSATEPKHNVIVIRTDRREGSEEPDQLWEPDGHKVAELDKGEHVNEISADGAVLISGLYTDTVILRSTYTGEEVGVLRHNAARISTASFSQDSTRMLTGSDDGSAKVWDARLGVPNRVILSESGLAEHVITAPNLKRVAIASVDPDPQAKSFVIKLVETATGRTISEIREAEKPVKLVYSPNSAYLVYAARTKLTIYSATNGALIESYNIEDVPTWIEFSRDSTRVAAGTAQGTVVLAEMADQRVATFRRSPRLHVKRINRVSFNIDNTKVVSASEDGTVAIWRVLDGDVQKLFDSSLPIKGAVLLQRDTKLLMERQLYDNSVAVELRSVGPIGETPLLTSMPAVSNLSMAQFANGLAYRVSPDGRRAAILSDGRVHMWSIVNGKELGIIGEEGKFITNIDFSANNERVVTAWSMQVNNGSDDILVADNAFRIWDVATLRALSLIRAPNVGVEDVTFSQDGQSVLVRGAVEMSIWDIRSIPPGTLFDVACRLLPEHDLPVLKPPHEFAQLPPICEVPAPVPESTGHVDGR